MYAHQPGLHAPPPSPVAHAVPALPGLPGDAPPPDGLVRTRPGGVVRVLVRVSHDGPGGQAGRQQLRRRRGRVVRRRVEVSRW